MASIIHGEIGPYVAGGCLELVTFVSQVGGDFTRMLVFRL
jgi:hypothetical protein